MITKDYYAKLTIGEYLINNKVIRGVGGVIESIIPYTGPGN